LIDSYLLAKPSNVDLDTYTTSCDGGKGASSFFLLWSIY